MYRYDEFDHQFVRERTAQFRDQANRRLQGELTEDEFRPLRLMNGHCREVGSWLRPFHHAAEHSI
jgi:sulfite reductase beta subunit-like hemoprotein